VVADELPETVAARVVERLENGEAVAEVSAWLVDLGYRVSPDEVAVIASQARQRRDDRQGTQGTGRADGGSPR
jgi:hypothetical protein